MWPTFVWSKSIISEALPDFANNLNSLHQGDMDRWICSCMNYALTYHQGDMDCLDIKMDELDFGLSNS